MCPDIVFACVVLHNFCESKNIELNPEDVDRIIIEERANTATIDKIYSYFTKDGAKVRDAITRYFNEYFIDVKNTIHHIHHGVH